MFIFEITNSTRETIFKNDHIKIFYVFTVPVSDCLASDENHLPAIVVFDYA